MRDAETRRFVRERAGGRCEYCRLHENHSELPHHIEHIVARKHGGSDDLDNLALACHRCNLHKGPNLSGIDPVTGEVQSLFHPRRDQWASHFAFWGAYIEGLTGAGRATVEVLALNDPRRIELREELGPPGALA
ncbi:MAG: HNH endonuclease [Acidobacteriota bacterium]|nr:HNH endonuclease [Acidobacteriota bacterium]